MVIHDLDQLSFKRELFFLNSHIFVMVVLSDFVGLFW